MRHKNFRGSDVSELSVYISFVPVGSGVASVDNWGGGGGANIHVSCFASLISFEIDCF